jgi:hypothetical protein
VIQKARLVARAELPKQPRFSYLRFVTGRQKFGDALARTEDVRLGTKFKTKRRMNMTTKTAKPIQKSKKLASVKPLVKVAAKKITLRRALNRPIA